MHILDKIVTTKLIEMRSARAARPLPELIADAKGAEPARGFVNSLLKSAAIPIIAEVKRASPSRGVIRSDLDLSDVAAGYTAAGAACLSVLTDKEYFSGSLEILQAIRRRCPSIPILRKDFTIDPYQIWEAKAAGADAVLLIARILNPDTLQDLAHEVWRADLDVVVEVHSESELEAALPVTAAAPHPSRIALGVNNRDLDTFKVDLETSVNVIKKAKHLVLANGLGKAGAAPLFVSESGIFTGNDIAKLRAAGAGAFLIGESLMATGDPGTNLKKLLDSAAHEGVRNNRIV